MSDVVSKINALQKQHSFVYFIVRDNGDVYYIPDHYKYLDLRTAPKQKIGNTSLIEPGNLYLYDQLIINTNNLNKTQMKKSTVKKGTPVTKVQPSKVTPVKKESKMEIQTPIASSKVKFKKGDKVFRSAVGSSYGRRGEVTEVTNGSITVLWLNSGITSKDVNPSKISLGEPNKGAIKTEAKKEAKTAHTGKASGSGKKDGKDEQKGGKAETEEIQRPSRPSGAKIKQPAYVNGRPTSPVRYSAPEEVTEVKEARKK